MHPKWHIIITSLTTHFSSLNNFHSNSLIYFWFYWSILKSQCNNFSASLTQIDSICAKMLILFFCSWSERSMPTSDNKKGNNKEIRKLQQQQINKNWNPSQIFLNWSEMKFLLLLFRSIVVYVIERRRMEEICIV